MGITLASIISMKVLFWQIFLGIVQTIGLKVGGRKSLLFTYILVLFWTLTQTFGNLLIIQVIVQTVILFILLKKSG